MKNKIKKLEHYKDTTVGLYAIDRDPNEVSIEWIREHAFRLEDPLALTLKEFDKLPHGEMFATGTQPNSPEGIFMTRAGGDLRWVAVKGFGDDWTVYCHWSTSTMDYIRRVGDKLHNPDHIKLCVPCEDKVFSKYRY